MPTPCPSAVGQDRRFNVKEIFTTYNFSESNLLGLSIYVPHSHVPWHRARLASRDCCRTCLLFSQPYRHQPVWPSTSRIGALARDVDRCRRHRHRMWHLGNPFHCNACLRSGHLDCLQYLADGAFTDGGGRCDLCWIVRGCLRPADWGAPIGGAIVGAGVACMHYLGMWAVELPGRITWSIDLVVVSIALGMLLGMAALTVAIRRDDTRSMLLAALLLTLAIVSHHFTAMGAVVIIPDPNRIITALSLSPTALALAVASAAVAVLGMSFISALADRRVGDKSLLLATALNNMTQGVVMFDDAERLVICNDRYLEMYNLSPDVVRPGCTLIDIIQHRVAAGSLTRNSAEYRAELVSAMAQGKTLSAIVENSDGRVISVVNKPIIGGEYWVGTHEDITERRVAERKSASLSEQEARRAHVDVAIEAFRESIQTVLQTVR